MAKYIDAEVLIDLLYEFEPENWTNSDRELQAENDFELFRSLVEAEPAADVKKVKHGYWATDEEDIKWGNSLKRKYCSVCKTRPYFDKDERKFILTAYCSHCGAKMDGKEK